MSTARENMIERAAEAISRSAGCHGCDLDDGEICFVCRKDAAVVIDAIGAVEMANICGELGACTGIRQRIDDALRTRVELLPKTNLSPEEQDRLDAANAVVAAIPISNDYATNHAADIIRRAARLIETGQSDQRIAAARALAEAAMPIVEAAIRHASQYDGGAVPDHDYVVLLFGDLRILAAARAALLKALEAGDA